jgi:hypothetical protein
MPLTATTLTLPCNKERVTPLRSHTGLEHMCEVACQGLRLTPEQLRQELEISGDIPDLQSGTLTPKALRLMAKTLALMRYPYPPEPRVIGTTLHGVRVLCQSKNEG